LDHLRRLSRRPVEGGDVEQLDQAPDSTDTASAVIETLDTRAAVALIARLPRDQAEAVLLRVVVGLDVAATAAVLGKRPGAVRTAAHRGLRRLAEQLSRESVTRSGAAAPVEMR
jgi:RNA polymerase sigma-70 factor (ECF subfamily)